MDDAELRATINDLVADEDLIALRITTCEAFADALRCASTYLHVPAYLTDDDALRGLSSVVDMSAELASSTIDLFKTDRWYAGNSLIRQLIETEYLLTIFAADRAIASDWQHAPPEQLRRWWNPAAMRAKTNGRFADEEYWGHCERGGHPSPDASHLLRNTLRARLDRRFFWIDLVIHLKRAWFATKECLIAFGYAERLGEDSYVRAIEALEDWSKRDQRQTSSSRCCRTNRGDRRLALRPALAFSAEHIQRIRQHFCALLRSAARLLNQPDRSGRRSRRASRTFSEDRPSTR